jgi:3-hydroxyisobutyrate dehydrogenase-like beta-hydroxyacid dehydrogenase
MNVGFVGLGRMGKGMALRILGGGHDLAVYDVVPEATAPLATAGARVASSVADVCKGRNIVITMLVEDATVTEVTLGTDGIRDSLSPETIHLAMGTYGVAAIRTLADAHASAKQVLVAAPVVGRPDRAAEGQLGIIAAGPPEAVRRCHPLFQVMGTRIFDAGAKPELATAIKLANNMVLGAAIVAQAERRISPEFRCRH